MVLSIFFWKWKNGNGTKLEMYCVTKTFLQIQVKAFQNIDNRF